MLGELCEAWGEGREAALCRELTKRFEEVRRGTLAELRDGCDDDPPRGEVVLVVAGAGLRGAAGADSEGAELAPMLEERMQKMSLKQAVAEVTAETGLPRRLVYQAALRLGGAP